MSSLYLSELSQDTGIELTDQLLNSQKGMCFTGRDNGRIIHQIRYDIEDAYAKGKISKQQSFVNTNENENETGDNKLEGVNETHIKKKTPI